MKQSTRKILVTTALPYANGDLHLGHCVEFIQTDIWVRTLRLLGHDCTYVCGSDAHGSAIMISAQKENTSPEALIERVRQSHIKDLAAFHISLDNFYTTHSEENRQFAIDIFTKLKNQDDITVRQIQQAYDSEVKMFLPDRYVKGICPRCDAEEQYGDNCEVCGATYNPIDLNKPKSILSGATPIEKESDHFFFQLPRYQDILKQWLHQGHLQEEIVHKLAEWFQAGLKEWDISRDAPYFGIEIPDAPGKYFYVWLDAPVGYMASFKNLCQQRPDLDFDEYWGKDSKVELYHFIGKDIIYFHALFWPAILLASGFRTPTNIFAHGFLTVNGLKMSKSRGTFINAKTYLKQLDSEYLRYYFAAKLGSGIDDVDFNFEDFRQRVNSDLIGKVVNIASRCAKFINKYFNNRLSSQLPVADFFQACVMSGDSIAELYLKREYNAAIREIMEWADRINQYIDQEKPWLKIKEDHQKNTVQDICTQGLNMFHLLMIYLKPVLPQLGNDVTKFLNCLDYNWAMRSEPLLDHEIKPFQALKQRITEEQINAINP